MRIAVNPLAGVEADDDLVVHAHEEPLLQPLSRWLGERRVAEVPRVDLADALAVCVAIRKPEPERYERAAPRWLAGYWLERREATPAHVQTAAWAFDNRRASRSRDARTALLAERLPRDRSREPRQQLESASSPARCMEPVAQPSVRSSSALRRSSTTWARRA
jgi:hypothetical protein